MRVPRQFNGGRNSLLNRWYWDSRISIYKRMKLNPYLMFTQIGSKWVKDINGRAQTIKLLKENIDINPCDLRFRQWFFRYDTKITDDKKKNLTSSK